MHYGFDAHGYMGQTLTQALQTGEFTSMELVAPELSHFDQGGGLKITERCLTVRADLPKTVTAARIRNAVRAFKQQPDGSSYSKLRIHYKTASGKLTSATLEFSELDAAFTLKEQIEFTTDVEAQQDSLCSTIVDGMKSLLQSVPV